VALAFARHATSKLETAEDLNHVRTLGFRGEALASIASVSRVALVTRPPGAGAGVPARLEGGLLVQQTPIGAPQGTVISVENLFYNMPARLKFLKSETAERSHISALITRYAMAYPNVRFKLVLDNRTHFQSSGSGDVREVLGAVYGVDVARQMIELGSVYEAPPPSPPRTRSPRSKDARFTRTTVKAPAADMRPTSCACAPSPTCSRRARIRRCRIR